MRKFGLSILIGVLVCSCTNKKNDQQLADFFNEKLCYYNLRGNASVRFQNTDELNVHIEYFMENGARIDSSFNDYFLGKYSNEIIINTLMYSCVEKIIDLDEVNFLVESKNFKLKKSFSKEDLQRIELSKERDSIQFKMFEFAIKEMRYQGTFFATMLITHLSKNFPKRFNYEGTFWDLLRDYSEAIKSPKEDLAIIYSFLSFAGSYVLINDSKREMEQQMMYFLKMGGYGKEILYMSSVELIEYMEENYKL